MEYDYLCIRPAKQTPEEAAESERIHRMLLADIDYGTNCKPKQETPEEAAESERINQLFLGENPPTDWNDPRFNRPKPTVLPSTTTPPSPPN